MRPSLAIPGLGIKIASWSLWHQCPSQLRLSPSKSYSLHQTGKGSGAGSSVAAHSLQCKPGGIAPGLLRSCHLGSRQLLASTCPTQPGWPWHTLVGATENIRRIPLSFNISREQDRRKMSSPVLPLRPPLLAAPPAPSDLLNGERGRCCGG